MSAKRPSSVLGEHVLERQPAQDARERVGVGADRVGDLGAGARPVGQDIGHAQLGGDVEQLGRQVAVDQAREVALRRDSALRALPAPVV